MANRKGGGGMKVLIAKRCPKCGKDMLYVPSKKIYFCHHCKMSVPDFIDSFMRGFAKP
jgi:ribosomal protein L37AE/L43A